MKLKSLLIAALALAGLAAGQAFAQNSEKDPPGHPNIGTNHCSLAASHYYVPVGQSYSYSIRVSFVDFGPLPPPTFRPRWRTCATEAIRIFLRAGCDDPYHCPLKPHLTELP